MQIDMCMHGLCGQLQLLLATPIVCKGVTTLTFKPVGLNSKPKQGYIIPADYVYKSILTPCRCPGGEASYSTIEKNVASMSQNVPISVVLAKVYTAVINNSIRTTLFCMYSISFILFELKGVPSSSSSSCSNLHVGRIAHSHTSLTSIHLLIHLPLPSC